VLLLGGFWELMERHYVAPLPLHFAGDP